MDAPLEVLTTVDTVIDALGGNSAVAELTGRRYDQSPSNWRARGWFPPNTFLVMTDALRAAGKTAPASLWHMTEQPVDKFHELAEKVGN